MSRTQTETVASPAAESSAAAANQASKRSPSVVQLPADSTTPNPQPESGFATLLISISLVLAIFLVALDTTILSTAIPKITDDFESFNDVGWYVGVYSLTSAVFQLLFGKFYTIFSVKYTFLVSVGIFEIGSILCAAAPVSNVLIFGRALAGIGSAGIFAGAFIVVSQTIPLRWRPIYNSIFGALYGIASVVGPVMGGLLTDKATWRWCFWINVPAGVMTVIVLVFCFNPKDDPSNNAQRIGDASIGQKVKASIRLMNLPSTAVLISATICLLLALQWGGSEYHWKNGRIVALLTVASVSTLVFVLLQAKQKDLAFVPYRVLKQRTVLACCWFAFTAGSSVVVLIYYIPVWFQAVLGVTALKSGFLNLSFVLSLVAGSLISGALTSFVGYYTPFLIVSSILRAIGAGLLTTLEPHTPSWKYIFYQIIYGFGDGCGMQQPMIALQNVLPPKDIPMGISVLIFTQTLGGAIFIAVAQSIFTDRLVSNIDGMALQGQISAQDIIKSGATSFRQQIKDSTLLSHVVQAYSKAVTQTFYIAVALACLSIFGAAAVEWKKITPEQASEPNTTTDGINTASATQEGTELRNMTKSD